MRISVMGIDVTGIQVNSAAECLLGAGPVPFVVQLDKSERYVRIRECVIQRERLVDGSQGLTISFCWRHQTVIPANIAVGFCKASVGGRVCRRPCYHLLVEFDAFL